MIPKTLDNLFFKTAVHQCNDFVVITDADSLILYVNPSFENHTGYKLKNIKEKNISIIKSGLHNNNFYKRLWSSIKKGNSVSQVFINKKKNGELYYENKTITPIKNEKGKVEYYLSTSKDFTKEFTLKREVVDQNKFIHSILKNTDALIVGLDKDAKIVLFNGACEKLTGYKFSEVKGKNVYNVFIPKNNRPSIKNVIDNVLTNTNKFKKHINTWLTKSKKEILISWSNTILDESNSDGLIILSTGINITKEKENEDKLIALNSHLDEKVKIRTSEIKLLNSEILLKRNLLQKVNTSLPSIIYLLDFKLKQITLINNQLTDNIKFPFENDVILDFKEFISYFKHNHSKAISVKSFIDGQTNELSIHLNSNEYVLQHKTVVFESDKNNKSLIYLGVLTDISDLKTIQNRLEESQKIAHIGTWDWNIQTNELYWTDEIYRIFELDPKVFKPSYTTFLEIIHQEDRQLLEEMVHYAIVNNMSYELVHRIETRPGKIKYVIENGICHYDENGKANRMIGTVRDITEVEYTKKRLEEAQNLAQIGTWEFNIVTNEFLVSEQMYDIYELDVYENYMSVDFVLNHVHPDDKTLVVETPNKAAQKRESYFMEYRIITESEKLKYVVGRGYAEYSSNGEVIKLLGSIQDITKEKELQKALIESEEKYRLLSDNNQDLISLRDINGKALFISNSVEKLLGYNVDEYSKFNLFDLIHPEDVKKIRNEVFNLDIANKGKGVTEGRLKHKNGEYLWMNTVTSPVFDENGNLKHIVGSTRDVTKRKQLEMILIENEEKYRSLYENALVGIFRTNIKTKKAIEVNNVCVNLFGYDSKTDFLNNCNSSVGYANEEERNTLFKELEECFIIENREVLFSKKDGTTFWGYTSLKLLPDNEIMEGVIVDISLSKSYEERLQKNINEKDLLLKEIHHRVKNNLQIISSLLKLQIQKNDNPILIQALTESKERVRAIALIHEKMYLSDDISTIDFCEYLNNLVKSIYALHKDRNVKLIMNLEKFVTDINVAIPLALVCYEIFSNAFKHAFNSSTIGELSIDLKNSNGRITIKISDNGPGFIVENVDEKKSLGWSLINNLSKQAKASINIKSQLGQGSEFVISL